MPPDVAAPETAEGDAHPADVSGVEDDRLRLLFTCCHPAIGQAAQMALALRTLCGLSTRELLPERLQAVLGVVYLLFNEGYAATETPGLIRPDLCAEAIRLARLIAELMPQESEALGLSRRGPYQVQAAIAALMRPGEETLAGQRHE